MTTETITCEYPDGDPHPLGADGRQTAITWHRYASNAECRRPLLCAECYAANAAADGEKDDPCSLCGEPGILILKRTATPASTNVPSDYLVIVTLDENMEARIRCCQLDHAYEGGEIGLWDDLGTGRWRVNVMPQCGQCGQVHELDWRIVEA